MVRSLPLELCLLARLKVSLGDKEKIDALSLRNSAGCDIDFVETLNAGGIYPSRWIPRALRPDFMILLLSQVGHNFLKKCHVVDHLKIKILIQDS